MLTLLVTWCFAPHIVRLRKDQHSKLEAQFPLSACHYPTIVKLKSPKLNRHKSGTVCVNSMACPPLDAGFPNTLFSAARASTSLKTQLIKLPLNSDSCRYARFASWNFSHILSLVRPCQGFLLTTTPTRQAVRDACVCKRQCSNVGQRSGLAELSWLPSGPQLPGAPPVLAILHNKPMQSFLQHILFYCTSQMLHFFFLFKTNGMQDPPPTKRLRPILPRCFIAVVGN